VEHTFAVSERLFHPDPEAEELEAWAKVPARVQPLTWTRKNGRTSLVIGATAHRVVGRSPEAGRALLDRLLAWSTQPQFTMRHCWRAGDLVVWDNSGILHRARSAPGSPPSVLHRTTIAGEEAIA
jgi:alpha-ketoglutarate-dependent taurine dioxygenase